MLELIRTNKTQFFIQRKELIDFLDYKFKPYSDKITITKSDIHKQQVCNKYKL